MIERDTIRGVLMASSYNPIFIVLSCFISIVGCWTALELLQRRTSARGSYNWSLLVGAATAMGAVAIWSMHFIGMQAIVMANGDSDKQIVYSAGFTAGSFFLAICAVAFAFFMSSVTESVNIYTMIVGGLGTGAAICGMHYLGQAGISNYNSIFDTRYIIGSVMIAVVAATSALSLFFYLTNTWTNALWKRLCCAVLLGSAVSGMHWTASAGTTYTARGDGSANPGSLSRSMTVVIVSCLSIGCCSLLIAFAVLGQRSRKRCADRAQQAVLGCAVWDPEGRLLVNSEGLLVCRKISNTYLERFFDDMFSMDHPVFSWIFRASRSWKGVADLIPAMKNYLRQQSVIAKVSPSGFMMPGPSSEVRGEYSRAFEALFCIAASELAAAIQVPLEKLGVLYDDVVSTGTLQRGHSHLMFPHTSTLSQSISDLEIGQVLKFGRGQLLFVVQHADRAEVSQLKAIGFRFAPVSSVIDSLARSMQITPQELLPHLENMQRFSTQPKMLSPGVHVAFFALRPLYQRGFDVLVRRDARNLLPSVKLPIERLDANQLELVSTYDNWKVGDLLKHWQRQSVNHYPSEDHKIFFDQLCTALKRLGEEIGEDLFREAKLTARPLRSPCDPTHRSDGTPTQAILLALRLITDVHQSQLANNAVFISSKFLLTQQHVYPNSPDHEIFSRRMYRDFANAMDEAPLTKVQGAHGRKGYPWLWNAPLLPRWSAAGMTSPITSRQGEDTSSEKNLVEAPGHVAFGGIHVSNEVNMDVCEIESGPRSSDIQLVRLGVHSEAGIAPTEKDSFISELISLSINERRHQR